MAQMLGTHAAGWGEFAKLGDGVSTGFRQLALAENDWHRPNNPIMSLLPTTDETTQGKLPVGTFRHLGS